MDRFTLIQFLILFLALPSQYFISQYWSNDSIQRSEALKNLIDGIYYLDEEYLSLEAWKKWYLRLVIDIPKKATKSRTNTEPNEVENQESYDDADEQESVAYEVLAWRKNKLYFSESSQTRMNHFKEVKFKIGQVIKHKALNVHGVIIGWDLTAKAPENWLEYNYNENERERLVDQPHYLILIDSKFISEDTSKYYIAQEHAELLTDTIVNNKLIKSFFQSYDNGKYKPKKFLEIVYPYD